jgi:hypothetical protein
LGEKIAIELLAIGGLLGKAGNFSFIKILYQIRLKIVK